MTIINIHHIRKRHYRRCVCFLILSTTATHIVVPEAEHIVNLIANLVWLFDPTHEEVDSHAILA